MNESDCNPPEIEGSTSLTDERLKPQLERLRSLRSAWGALAPSGVLAKSREIAESGRVVTEHLTELAGRSGQLESAAIEGADRLLENFELSMRNIATRVPVPQFRSNLPGLLESDRRGVLDLLDVMVGGLREESGRFGECIGAIDYIITLLCTTGQGTGTAIVHDPVSLTTRLHSICDGAAAEDDPRLADIEAEFFAASNMDSEGLREEIQLRTLRTRKADLGMAFFAPRILRAIVTYNSALLDRVSDEIIDSGDWGVVQGAKELEARDPRATSLFACGSLPTLAAAVRRRAQGGKPEPNPADRIAWALDFDYLEDVERKALTGEALGTPEDPLGTAILVGLMCRSLAVLSIELQTIDISPDAVADAWVRELDAIFQDEINTKISGDAYKVACALSELKNKFLFAPLADNFREKRAPKLAQRAAARQHAARPDVSLSDESVDATKGKREKARDLVRDALEASRTEHRTQQERASLRHLPWARLASIGTAAVAVLSALVYLSGRDADLSGWNSKQLKLVSPYLSAGHRNGGGSGRAFVGTIMDEWKALPAERRAAAAETLVQRLRDEGVTQVMIYDRDEALRIQAIGSQPIQTR